MFLERRPHPEVFLKWIVDGDQEVDELAIVGLHKRIKGLHPGSAYVGTLHSQ
ncbi:hypothetical protein ACFPBZ_00845 [Actinomycetospora atypica]|uniref:Uncharacterized protein n=1 Tax=Actinomycetospora atypica TaxID=1290095 RepID=A0ABV9YDA6_9PSEU